MHFKRKIVDNSKVIVDLVSKKQFLVFLYDDSESWEDDDEIKIKQPSGEFKESFLNDIKPKWELDGKSCCLTIATGELWAYLSFKPKE